MSLQDAFAAVGRKPSHDELARWVKAQYGSSNPLNPHRARRKAAAQRLRFYEDAYDSDAEAIVSVVFETAKAREQRKKLVSLSKPHNITRRIVDEESAVYDKPARRVLLTDYDQRVYDLVAETTDLDELRNEAHRLTNLCNEVLHWVTLNEAKEPVLRLITPDAFDVVPDPRDDLRIGALIVDRAPVTLDPELAHRLTAYEMWDNVYLYEFNADWDLLREPTEHGLARIPGYLQHRRKPRVTLLDATAGNDLISAHGCVVLLNLLILRISKAQGENQPILSGNLARMAKGQSLDGETPLALPPGVVAQMLNMKTDPDHYLRVIRHFVGGVAATYGMSYEQFTFAETADVASGKAYSVRREKLAEIRDQQVLRSKKDEQRIAQLFADMLRVYGLPTFEPRGMQVAFSDPRIPQDAREELEILEKEIALGVGSVVKFLCRKYGLTEAEAEAELARNQEVARRYSEGSGDQADAVAALGILVRAGFDPARSARVLGLPTIPHLGVLPVTVQAEPPPGARQLPPATVKSRGKA